MKNLDSKDNISSIVVNPHPIVELQIKNLKVDEVGVIADCILFNSEFNKIESSFLLDIELAEKIIEQLKSFINIANKKI